MSRRAVCSLVILALAGHLVARATPSVGGGHLVEEIKLRRQKICAAEAEKGEKVLCFGPLPLLEDNWSG